MKEMVESERLKKRRITHCGASVLDNKEVNKK